MPFKRNLNNINDVRGALCFIRSLDYWWLTLMRKVALDIRKWTVGRQKDLNNVPQCSSLNWPHYKSGFDSYPVEKKKQVVKWWVSLSSLFLHLFFSQNVQFLHSSSQFLRQFSFFFYWCTCFLCLVLYLHFISSLLHFFLICLSKDLFVSRGFIIVVAASKLSGMEKRHLKRLHERR